MSKNITIVIILNLLNEFFSVILTSVFIILKSAGYITWSWGWVLSPLWITSVSIVISLIWLFVVCINRKSRMNTYSTDIKHTITELTKCLEVDETYIAGMLNITEKRLNQLKKFDVGNTTTEVLRLKRSYEVVAFIYNNFVEKIASSEIKNILENGRITIDPNDEEDGTTALITFICAHPDATDWVPSVNEAVDNYLRLRSQKSGNVFSSQRLRTLIERYITFLKF